MAVYRFCPPVTETSGPDYIPADVSGQDHFYPSPEPIRRLMRRYKPTDRALNVFKLVDGTYTTDQPYEAIPGTVISHVYWGGHCDLVGDTEAAALQAAGYTVTLVAGFYGDQGFGSGVYGG